MSLIINMLRTAALLLTALFLVCLRGAMMGGPGSAMVFIFYLSSAAILSIICFPLLCYEAIRLYKERCVLSKPEIAERATLLLAWGSWFLLGLEGLLNYFGFYVSTSHYFGPITIAAICFFVMHCLIFGIYLYRGADVMAKTAKITSALASILTAIMSAFVGIVLKAFGSPSFESMVVVVAFVAWSFCWPLFFYGIIQLGKCVKYKMISGLEFAEKIILFSAWGIFPLMNGIFLIYGFFAYQDRLNMIDYANGLYLWVAGIVGLLLFYYGLLLYRHYITARKTHSVR